MLELTTTFLGLQLKNPFFIISSQPSARISVGKGKHGGNHPSCFSLQPKSQEAKCKTE